MTQSEREKKIQQALNTALTPTQMSLIDESHLHVGHPGAQSGRGHYALSIVSTHFSKSNSLDRHRMIYNALGTLMETDIHALRIIKAASPEEE